jgi:hypothetical protein
LLDKLKSIARTCEIDIRESTVTCKNRGLDAIGTQIQQGARSQSKSLETVAYALSSPDEKLSTVAAELLQLAFRSPAEEQTPQATSPNTAASLIKALSKLPAAQAIDAAPAVVYAALRAKKDQELYATIDAHQHQRLVPRAYRYLMAAGGMRAWPKVQELGKSERLDVVLAGLDATMLWSEKAPQEREQICNWYRSLAVDARAVVASRASGYLVGCGPTYFEPMLATDEERINDKSTTRMALDAYQQACLPDRDATPPTAEQCSRLKRMLITILESGQFEGATRAKALDSLRLNFPSAEVLKLATRYAHDPNALLSTKASEVTTLLQNDLPQVATNQ